MAPGHLIWGRAREARARGPDREYDMGGVEGHRIGNRDPYGRMGGRAKRSHKKQHGKRGGCGKSLGLAILALAGTVGGVIAVVAHWPT